MIDLRVFNSAWRAVHRDCARIYAIGKRYVIHLPAFIGCDLFSDLYLIWLLPAPWRVRQIVQIVAVILGLAYLFQH